MSTTPHLRLEQSWGRTQSNGVRFSFTVFNFSERPYREFALAFTSLTRATDDIACDNASFSRKFGHFHEFLPPEGFSLEAGGQWAFTVEGWGREPKHLTDGAQNPYLLLTDGTTVPIVAGDLTLGDQESSYAAPRLPPGRLQQPLHMVPWPANCSITEYRPAPQAVFPVAGTDRSVLEIMHHVSALHDRLFPQFASPIALTPVNDGLPVTIVNDGSQKRDGYEISFSTGEVRIASAGRSGTRYALITLAQLMYGAHADSSRFQFPAKGTIRDHPRHEWRGCHLDVSRQFFPLSDLTDLTDILAWHKFNVFHLHTSDDEAWRLEIDAYPELTEIGAWRGPHEKILPLHGSGGVRYGGSYSKSDVRKLINHAANLHVEILPEIDIPGHCTAVLQSLPELADGQEAPDCYRSIGGFPNNALNPAVPFTYEFLETVLGEIADLFPNQYLHVGGDEVDAQSWMASPLARKLKQDEGIGDTFALQSYFLRRVQKIVTGLGRKLAGWDEVSQGGGVEPEGTLLMAWQTPRTGAELARAGYDVVASPGQTYYLDMVQADDWKEPGASWAGTSPAEQTYRFEAADGFDNELADRLKGVQACIWTEHLARRSQFRRLVFPRLAAIGESAWTPAEQKNWDRFAAQAPLTPTL